MDSDQAVVNKELSLTRRLSIKRHKLRAERRWLPPDERLDLPGGWILGYLEKGDSHSHGARPVYSKHLDDSVDSDQEVVNKENCLGHYQNGRVWKGLADHQDCDRARPQIGCVQHPTRYTF